jgi:nucleoid-associated protein YgaU
MKQNQFEDLPTLSPYRFENFFNVFEDENGEKFYNILKSINIFPANDDNVETTHRTLPQDTWVSISYKFYNTIELWWLICAYNQIKNPVKRPESGTLLKILNKQYVGLVLRQLNLQVNT